MIDERITDTRKHNNFLFIYFKLYMKDILLVI